MSAAVATRPPVAALCRPRAPARSSIPQDGHSIAATLVADLVEPSSIARMFGRHLLQVHTCLLPGELEAGDVIQVDFDVQQVREDGIYLLRRTDADGHQWFGARWFHASLAGLMIREGSEGSQRWQKVTPDLFDRFIVCGMVRDVYKTRIRWEAAR